ncbi:MAG: ribosome maturation factor RimP [Bacillota bacterium]|nr:ribosome maturation factor RimP [Bacillota bacterium]
MAKKKIIQLTEEILDQFLSENGYELYNSEFIKEGRDWFLRIYIDKNDGEGYIGTEDCEKVSRYLSEKLDEMDPIEQNYYLEVSSPGMDRPLIKPEHYERYIGSEVEIKLYKGKDGTKKIEGVLEAFEKDPDGEDFNVRVTDHNSKEWNLQLAEIAKARLAVII